VNENPQPRRIAFLLLATLLPASPRASGRARSRTSRRDCSPVAWRRSSLRRRALPARARRRTRSSAGEAAERTPARGERGAGRALLEVQTLASAIEGMDEGMWITDANGVVLRHNEALRPSSARTRSSWASGRCSWSGAPSSTTPFSAPAGRGVTSKVEVSMDAPRSKTLEVHIAPWAARSREARPCSVTSPSASGWSASAGLRGQRQPRAPDAHRRHPGLRRDAALRGAVRCQARPADGGDHPPTVGAPRELVEDLLELSRLDAGERPLSPPRCHWERSPVRRARRWSRAPRASACRSS
jgi:hypothetical protein